MNQEEVDKILESLNNEYNSLLNCTSFVGNLNFRCIRQMQEVIRNDREYIIGKIRRCRNIK